MHTSSDMPATFCGMCMPIADLLQPSHGWLSLHSRSEKLQFFFKHEFRLIVNVVLIYTLRLKIDFRALKTEYHFIPLDLSGWKIRYGFTLPAPQELFFLRRHSAVSSGLDSLRVLQLDTQRFNWRSFSASLPIPIIAASFWTNFPAFVLKLQLVCSFLFFFSRPHFHSLLA